MHLLPPGYIDLQSARHEIVRRRYGNPKPHPWVKRDPMYFEMKDGIGESKDVWEPDPVLLRNARLQYFAALRVLCMSLRAGKLKAEVDGCAIRPGDWRILGNARTIVDTGRFWTDNHHPELARFVDQPIGIPEKEFKAWVGRITRPKRRAPKSMVREGLEAMAREMPKANTLEIQKAAKDALESEGYQVPKEMLRRAWKESDPAIRPKRGRPPK